MLSQVRKDLTAECFGAEEMRRLPAPMKYRTEQPPNATAMMKTIGSVVVHCGERYGYTFFFGRAETFGDGTGTLCWQA